MQESNLSHQQDIILDGLRPLLVEKDFILLISFFLLTPTPSELLTTSNFPVLEVFFFTLKEGRTLAEHAKLVQPLLERFDAEGRRYAVSPATDAPAIETGNNSKLYIYVVAWRSIAEHSEMKKDSDFQVTLAQGGTVIQDVKMYGHIYL